MTHRGWYAVKQNTNSLDEKPTKQISRVKFKDLSI